MRVLVTRPEHQAQRLCELIQQAGGEARLFPAVEIVDPADPAPLRAVVDRLDDFHMAVFVSPNAVRRALVYIASRRALPAGLQLACVGRGSARELQRLGYDKVIAPSVRYDSEALLELPELHAVAGKRIVIFRGDGGRELLGPTLAARGADVEYIECYRRIRPQADAAPLLEDWRRRGIDIVTVTSTQGLRNLCDMLGETGRPWLLKTPLVVLSERTAEAALKLGFASRPLVASAASDEAIVGAILAWRARQNSL